MSVPPLSITIGAGLLSALLYATAASGSVASTLPVILSPLPIFMIGLSRDTRSAIIAGLTATFALGLAGGPLVGFAYLLANALVPIQLCRLAMQSYSYTDEQGKPAVEWYPAGLLLTWLSGMGIVLLLLSALAIQTMEGWLRGWITEAAQIEQLTTAFIQAQTQSGQQSEDPAELKEWLIRVAMPAIGLFWLGLSILNGALAQRLLIQMGQNARPSPGLLFMEIPKYMLLPVVIGLALSFFPGDLGLIGLTLAAIGGVPYFCLGLAAVHVTSRRMPARRVGLIVFYILLLVYGWPCILVAGLGVVEQFAGFRYKTGLPHKGS